MSESDLGPRDEPSPDSGTLAALGVTDDRLHRLSVVQFHMIDSELSCEDARVELLEGLLVLKSQPSPQRASVWRKTDRALGRLVPDGWFVTTQGPVTLTESEPAPDVMLVRGDPEDYCERHPGPAEVPLAIEVADVDLALDRGIKKRIYARAGIPTYWIVNLVDRRVEVHADPTGPADAPHYARRRDYGPGEEVPVAIGGREVGRIPVSELLTSA
jgi:Uma2 family endonuclease